jgi:type I restriction enzyme S subunit
MNDVAKLYEAEQLLAEVERRPRRFDAYPNYHESKTRSVTQIPTHWQEKRVKFIGSVKYGLGEPPRKIVDGLPFVRATDIERGQINLDTIQRVDPDGVPWSRDPGLKANDILVVRSGAYTGDSAIVPAELEEQRAIAGYDMVLRVTRAVPEFVAYTLLSKYMLQGQIYLAKMRAAQPHLNAEELGGFHIVLPPLDEQRAIARFLDRETAKIDSLVAKKRRLIELLGEKRTALISHAVTKGLNPAAPTKPSGIDWLGDVPEHWKTRAFRYSATIPNGQVDPGDDRYSDLPLIAPNHIESGTGRLFDFGSAAEQSAESGKYLFEKGMVLYSKIRPALAKVCIAPVRGLCSADMYPVSPRRDLLAAYLLYFMLSRSFTDAVTLLSARVVMPKINRRDLGGFAVLVPPIEEQTSIVQTIEYQAGKMDRLIVSVESAVRRLNEYRSSLISAAVTGQIDVRKEETI